MGVVCLSRIQIYLSRQCWVRVEESTLSEEQMTGGDSQRSLERLERKVKDLEAKVARLESFIAYVAPELLETWKTPEQAAKELCLRGKICSAASLRDRIRAERVSRNPTLKEGLHYKIKDGIKPRYSINVDAIIDLL